MKLSYQDAKDRKIPKVFSYDFYGGIECFDLNWEENAVYIKCEFNDTYDNIESLFLNSDKYGLFATIDECGPGINILYLFIEKRKNLV